MYSFCVRHFYDEIRYGVLVVLDPPSSFLEIFRCKYLHFFRYKQWATTLVCMAPAGVLMVDLQITARGLH